MNSETINILDAIVSCDYIVNNRDYIISLFYDTFMGKNCSIFITPKYNNTTNKFEKILVVKWSVHVPLKGRNYDIPILIYLPRMFPSVAPEIYIELTDEIGVNPQSFFIEKETLKITLNSLKNWNMSTSSLSAVLSEINADFTNIFPVYKLNTHEKGKFNYGDDCKLQQENLVKVDFDAPSKQDRNSFGVNFGNYQNNFQNNDNIFDIPFVNKQNNQNNQNKNQPLIDFSNIEQKKVINNINHQQKSIYFSEDQIKLIYINELKANLIPKIKIERNKLKAHEEKLRLYKEEFKNQIQETQSLATRKDEIIHKISNLSAGIHDEMVVLKNYIQVNSQFEFNFQNLDKFIKISDEALLKAVSAEAVLEDLLFYIKKGYEKKIFNFAETIKMTRFYSRELYSLKFYKEKLIKNMFK